MRTRDILPQAVKCKRCGYVWIKRVRRPKVCPKCKSAYWNKKKTRDGNYRHKELEYAREEILSARQADAEAII